MSISELRARAADEFAPSSRNVISGAHVEVTPPSEEMCA
jgi:hypothetical protein